MEEEEEAEVEEEEEEEEEEDEEDLCSISGGALLCLKARNSAVK